MSTVLPQGAGYGVGELVSISHIFNTDSPVIVSVVGKALVISLLAFAQEI